MKNCRNIPEEAKKEGEKAVPKAEVGRAEGEKQKWEGGELGTTGPGTRGKSREQKAKVVTTDHGTGPGDRGEKPGKNTHISGSAPQAFLIACAVVALAYRGASGTDNPRPQKAGLA